MKLNSRSTVIEDNAISSINALGKHECQLANNLDSTISTIETSRISISQTINMLHNNFGVETEKATNENINKTDEVFDVPILFDIKGSTRENITPVESFNLVNVSEKVKFLVATTSGANSFSKLIDSHQSELSKETIKINEFVEQRVKTHESRQADDANTERYPDMVTGISRRCSYNALPDHLESNYLSQEASHNSQQRTQALALNDLIYQPIEKSSVHGKQETMNYGHEDPQIANKLHTESDAIVVTMVSPGDLLISPIAVKELSSGEQREKLTISPETSLRVEQFNESHFRFNQQKLQGSQQVEKRQHASIKRNPADKIIPKGISFANAQRRTGEIV
jgi:hypothetical protein